MLVSVRTDEPEGGIHSASVPAGAGHVSTVEIVAEERQYATAQCQTEDGGRRRRERRPRRRPRAPPAPPPYSTLPPAQAQHPHGFHPLPVANPRAESFRCGGVLPLPLPLTSPCQVPPLSPPPLCPPPPPTDLAAPPAHKRWPPWRWCVLLLAVVGICCVLAGAILGALRSQPRAHLTLLLLMIGAGAVLVVSAGVAWRAASRPFVPCRRLLAALSFSLSSHSHHTHALASPHTHRHRLLREGRRGVLGVHQPATIFYPEFQYRQPPPSYQASMQEYRLRLLLLDRSAPMAVSPPPTYRSHNGTLIRNAVPGSEHSYPPSYHSRALNRPPSRLGSQSVECCGRSMSVMSEPLSLSPAALTHTLNNVVIQNISYDDIKYSEEITGENKGEASANAEAKEEVKEEVGEEHPSSNMVTIVQTNCSEDFGPVILTISNSPGNNNLTYQTVNGEIDILAHL